MEPNQKDHDLLVRLDEKMNGLTAKVDSFTQVTMAYEMRLRRLEEDMTKLLPIPAFSHEQVVNEIVANKTRIDTLERSYTGVLSGWRAIGLLAGSVMGLISFLWILGNLLRLFH